MLAKYQNFTVDEWEKNVWFNDARKLEVHGSNRRVYAMSQTGDRMIPRCVIPTVKHDSGNIQVWECFASSGVGQLHIIGSTSGPKKTKQSWLSYTSLHNPIEHL